MAKAIQVALNGTAVDNDFYGDIVSLIVEENTNTASVVHLQLTSRLKDDGSWTYVDDDRLAPLNTVSIKIGFTGGGGLMAALGSVLGGGSGGDGLSAVFDGYVTAVHVDLGSEPGNTYVEVSGMDTSFLMSVEEKISAWPNLADSDIVQQIVSAYGVSVTADSTSTVHQDTDTTILQRGTDIQFVRDLAQRNGLEFYFQTDDKSGTINGYFRAPQLDGTPQPDLAIHFGDNSNLRNFSAQVSAHRPLNVKTSQMDVKGNSPNQAQVSDTQLAKLGAQDANALIGGPLGSLVTPKDAPAQMLVLGPPTSDSTELNTLAQAVRDEAGWFISASGEINSDAYQAVLRPHQLVLVKGAGKAYSGKYYVTRVVHEMKGDGSYTQKFEARRNARDLDGSEQFGGGGGGLPIPGI
jgi:phage protein D